MSSTHFCASSNRFRDKQNLNFDLQKVGQGYEVKFFAIASFDGKCQDLQDAKV